MSEPTLYLHPGGYSSLYIEMLMKELGCPFHRVEVNLLAGQQYSREFLRVNPAAVVPALSIGDRTYSGLKEVRKYLQETYSQQDIFQGGSKYLSKLDDFPVGPLTYGLAFHQERTHILRYPFHEANFFEVAREYVLNRSSKLHEALDYTSSEESVSQLMKMAEDHQSSLSSFVDEAGFDRIYTQLGNLLRYLEKEFEGDRVGVWLEGAAFTVSDIALGLLLHRVWQLGLDEELFTDGVLPNLSVYYSRIKNRASFLSTTGCGQHKEERRLVHPDERMAETAKYGMGVAFALAGLYIVKKALRK